MLLTGSVPHAYLDAANNPAEGTIAERRAAAQLVSHLSPALDDVDLYRAFEEVDALLAELAQAASTPEKPAPEILPRFHTTPVAVGLHVAGGPPASTAGENRLRGFCTAVAAGDRTAAGGDAHPDAWWDHLHVLHTRRTGGIPESGVRSGPTTGSSSTTSTRPWKDLNDHYDGVAPGPGP
ncbi:cobaltochelatase subunit CobN [uncultured Corynebacterium sp.]|uniref:cobaltochelatase subunit CobN n=1 Tax=uncultured Corynebacterium sp. TaxID=159447 RepID=UPI0025DBA910|nr:cobaltochelatase subunit CobN [uncultured Corynebacterium sp.]